MEKQFKLSGKVTHKNHADMIGLFFEDINFAADGGLYAELIENRSFEAVKSMGFSHNYVLQGDYLYAWSVINESDGKLLINENDPVNEANPHYVRFIASKDGAGFRNKAYDGIPVKKGMTYRVSFWAREVDYLDGDIEVRLAKDNKVIASNIVSFTPAQPENPNDYDSMVGRCAAKNWKKYETNLTADINENVLKGCVFEICLTKAGSMEFDIISVIPEDAVEGVFRKDLFTALKELKPGFLRFPGGCIVEGTSLMRRYRWKDTVGSIEERKINTNLWATQGGNVIAGFETPDCHYMQSYGIGFYEYFRLCELLSSDKRRCEPLPVLNIGVACQFRSYETVPVDSEEFEGYIQDALDLIEFAIGSTDTKYGALRASMGHPESFNMTFLSIGNEQWNSPHVDLNERYIRFEKAIHEVYPEIKCLGTAGPFIEHELHTEGWQLYRDECKNNPDFTYAVDEHYYVEPKWLYDHVNMYDTYPRDINVFAGEYAAHDSNQSNSIEAALAEASMLTGMEKNGDIIALASYAPLFNRIGHSQWTPDMIWFDEDSVIYTPSYYVQKLFSEYAGSEALDMNGQEKGLAEDGIYISSVRNEDKTILKIVNSNLENIELNLLSEDGTGYKGDVSACVLRSKGEYVAPVRTKCVDPDGPNKAVDVSLMSNIEICSMRKPQEALCEQKSLSIDGSITLAAKSLTVLVM